MSDLDAIEVREPVDTYTLGSVNDRLERVERHVSMLVTAVNSIGEQTTWLCHSIDAAFKGFEQLQQEIAKSGPLGLFKMLKGGMSGSMTNGDSQDG